MALLTKKRFLLLLLAAVAGALARRKPGPPPAYTPPNPPRPQWKDGAAPAAPTSAATAAPPTAARTATLAAVPDPDEGKPVPANDEIPPPPPPPPAADPAAAEAFAPTEPAAATDGRYAGSLAPLADGSSPDPAYAIKGNEGSKLFHTTDSPYYGRTKAEAWFATEDAAAAAGFTRWNAKALAAVPEGKYGKGSAAPKADGSSPGSGFAVKGNEDSMIFHTKESPSFGRTVAEVWFTSEDAARAAGFRHWGE